MCMYIYIYTYTHTYVCHYIYIYREREIDSLAVLLLDPVLDDADDDVVRHQAAALHDRLILHHSMC